MGCCPWSTETVSLMLGVTRRTMLATLALLGLEAVPAARADDSFAAWLAGLRREALARGIAGRTLDRALSSVRPIPAVIEADRRQPERRLTFAEYRHRVVNDRRIGRGRELLGLHRDLLGRVEARFHVPAEVIVALWGLESNFGERQGGYPVFAALATLAHEGRRASFFRKELLNALEIADSGHIEPELMLGSWAGAMGQNQFMPSTWLGYAVDFDGDGRRDIWRSLPDVFASTANYLARSGWDGRYIWGREVHAPGSLLEGKTGLDHRASLAAWSRRGVRLPDGGSLPEAPIQASLLGMDGGAAGSFLVYGNFRALMAWNRSTYFGVSVGLLADSLRDG
jgi:membrane-bound lytic murein transglycosylase B